MIHTPSACASSRRSSPCRLAWRTWQPGVTRSPHEKCRHRSWKPAFSQLNRPMEWTSPPRPHPQSPMFDRMSCGPSTMPPKPQLGAPSARLDRRLEFGDPPGTPKRSGPALGPLGWSPGAPEGPAGPPRANSRSAGIPWSRVKTCACRPKKARKSIP